MHRKKWVCRQGADDTFLMIEIDRAGYLVNTSNAPAIHQDTMDPLKHPCDGKFYDSRSQYDRVTRAHGCIEAGNELTDKQGNPKIFNRPRPKESIRESILKTMQGYRREVHG